LGPFISIIVLTPVFYLTWKNEDFRKELFSINLLDISIKIRIITPKGPKEKIKSYRRGSL
jgi:hypothetical protein